MDRIEKALREWCPEDQTERLESLLRSMTLETTFRQGVLDLQRGEIVQLSNEVKHYKQIAELANRDADRISQHCGASKRKNWKTVQRLRAQRAALLKDNKRLRSREKLEVRLVRDTLGDLRVVYDPDRVEIQFVREVA